MAKGPRSNLTGLIQQLVRTAIQTIPAASRGLYERVMKGVERKLLERVLAARNRVHIGRSPLTRMIGEVRKGITR